MTSSQFLKLVTKYVLDDPDTFTALRDRFEMCEHAQSKSVAAAFGYLIAIDEMNQAQQSIWKTVFDLIDNMENDAHDTTLLVFKAIYQWIQKEMDARGYREPNEIRGILYDMFADFIEPTAEEDDEL
jgi:hypothetical protein